MAARKFYMDKAGITAWNAEYTVEEVTAAIGTIARNNRGALFAIGDLIIGATDSGLDVGEVYDALPAELGFKRQTLMNYKRVAQAYPRSERVYDVSFSHYTDALGEGVTAEQSYGLLKQAEEGGWTRKQLRDARKLLQGNDGATARTEPEPTPAAAVEPAAEPVADTLAEALSLPNRELAKLLVEKLGADAAQQLSENITDELMKVAA